MQSCWIITDGKIGDEAQCVGVAEALGVPYELRRIHPRTPFTWLMPWGPIDPREAPDALNSPLKPPFPDLAIASGRRAVSYLRHIKNASKGRTFTVFLKDPKTGREAADFIWVPEHDRLRGENVFVTPTSPHKFSDDVLLKLRQTPNARLDQLQSPRIAVLVGGNSRHHTFSDANCKTFLNGLKDIMSNGAAGLMITTSRRTPPDLAKAIEELVKTYPGHFLWDGQGDNPYGAMLAKADGFIVTADSTNMIGEATCTGKPIHVFESSGGHGKIDRFLGTLAKLGVTHPFPGALKSTTYEPLNATPLIAQAIHDAISKRDPR
ncbi:MAG: mitochondrial fission ELM1 family protein [Rhodobacteraceae bacterium]|nr:mitochondrial fission ELM1 family protein [Paracoccaceae bacterium]